MGCQFEKTVKKWGDSGGIAVSKSLIGQKVYVLTEEDIALLKILRG